MNGTIKIVITPDGETKLSVEGVAGASCKDLTRELEEALGETTKDTKTADYYAVAKATVKAGVK